MSDALNETIQRLKSSPLFYLFLSSRELFHTNFWYWLSTLNTDETLKLFSDFRTTNEQLIYKREHGQSLGRDKSKVDLLISNGANPLVVVENKIKDFPTLSQLNRIRGSFDNSSIQYVLITLFSSPEIIFDGWKIRTYRDIAETINPEEYTENKYHRSLIEDYKSFCLNLAELAESLPLTTDYDFANSYNKDLFHSLNEIKLWEGYQKLRASHLLFHFNNRNNIETRYSINHQKATIDFFIQLRDGYLIALSLEDNQLRPTVGGKNPEKFAQNLLENRIFFSSNFMGRGNKPFLKYDNPGDTKYRYQYETVGNPLSFEQLFERICFEIEGVVRQKPAIENCIPS